MAGFAERGPVPVEGRCLWCGGKLRRYVTLDDTAPARYGYRGEGQFCTLSCGYDFGSQLATFGRRLRVQREPI